MTRINLKEAEKKLPQLFKLVEKGEEVIIITEDGNSYKITSVNKNKPQPRFGSANGLIEIADDFEEPLDDFKDYME